MKQAVVSPSTDEETGPRAPIASNWQEQESNLCVPNFQNVSILT